jgi:hypothetical protein
MKLPQNISTLIAQQQNRFLSWERFSPQPLLGLRLRVVFSIVVLVSLGHLLTLAQNSLAQNLPSRPASKQSAADVGNTGASPIEQLERDQSALAEKYKLLEEKLFSLQAFEQERNPERSELLQRAYIQSQEKVTTAQMQAIVESLAKSRFREAEQNQELVLAELELLLDLLQSEDRGKRLRDELQRHKAYLIEIERVLRIQKGIRGQLEGGVDTRRLAKSQEKTAERTERLADEISANEESGGNSPSKTNSSSNRSEETENGFGDDSKTPPGAPESQKSQSESDGDVPADTNAQSNEANPVRQRISMAQQRMREAQRKLENARRDESAEEMNLAERQLEKAKEELEDILRQLREEEVERTLMMMEERFRQMLEGQIRIYQATKKASQAEATSRAPAPSSSDAGQRNTNKIAIQTGKLAAQQNELATQAARALMLLREDGSSVAFPVTVDEMHDDMLQIASRLSASQVGTITIEIEEDVIDTLEYLIQALVQTQKDLAKLESPGKSQAGGTSGDQPLIDRLSEIKMLRGLQVRILKRHERYSRLLADPNDPIGVSEKSSLDSALERLALRQSQLTDITRDIVNEMNQ